MKYFSIERIKTAIDHLSEFHSKWVIVPLVFAINGINSESKVDPNDKSHAGTSSFLQKHFDGRLIGLPAPGNNNALRPKFKELRPVKGNYVLHQKVNLWGSGYSRAGYGEMKDQGLLKIEDGSYKLYKKFWNVWAKELPDTFHFEELLVWLYAFSGFEDSISSWNQLSRDLQTRYLGEGKSFPPGYEVRFNVDNGVAWPADLRDTRPSNEEFQSALLPNVDGKTGTSMGSESLIDIAQELESALEASNIRFGERHSEMVRRFLSSLISKPFAILTGLSGSGKTQIAIRFGEWLGLNRSLVVPVRPDWTSGEALFGFPNLLDNKQPREWVLPDTIKFVLSAVDDSSHLYLLVLDEMNLAHVERYFGDFLSGMESGKPVIPNLELAEGKWRLKENAPSAIPIPQNLLVVGTVNVDETTYMFSPKVLDRAHTIEFRVDATELDEDLAKPVPCSEAGEKSIGALIAVLQDPNWHRANPGAASQTIAESLRAIHSILSRDGFEFGHRVFFESLRFAAIYEAAGENSSENILDVVVYQKVLPRLHGSQKRLGKTLRALAKFASDLEPITAENYEAAALFDPAKQLTSPAKLPRTFAKLAKMYNNLRNYQFSSFAE
jgi:hypothetical protein